MTGRQLREKQKAPVFTEAHHRPEISNPVPNMGDQGGNVNEQQQAGNGRLRDRRLRQDGRVVRRLAWRAFWNTTLRTILPTSAKWSTRLGFQAVRQTLLDRGIRPEPCRLKIKKVERSVTSDERKSLASPKKLED